MNLRFQAVAMCYSLLIWIHCVDENIVDPDQLASEEAN